MTTPTFELIRGEPDLEQGLVFAALAEAAADGLFATMLGSRWQTILAEAYRRPGHDLSYEHVTFARDADRVVGLLSAFTAEAHEASSMGPLARAAGWRTVRMALVATALLPLFTFLGRIRAGDFYIQILAVSADRRGQGIGSTLIDHAERRARDLERSRLTLHVDVTNAAAQRLYERRGLTVEATSKKAYLIAGEQVRFMVKPLDETDQRTGAQA